MIEALLGPLGWLLGAIAAGLALWFGGKWKGATGADQRSQARNSEAYREERKRQDGLDTGADADDAERVERLRRLANGGGAGDA